MRGGLTQPKVEGYIGWLKDSNQFGMNGHTYDDQSERLLDELFVLLEQVSPTTENGGRSFWLRAERGPIEDFGDVDEEIADGTYETEEEFVQDWKCWFPDEIKWYECTAIESKSDGFRAVWVKHKLVIVQDRRKEQTAFPTEISEFVQWLVDGVKECIEMLKAGSYNDFVRENLPPQHRVGVISHSDYWTVWPELRTDFFKDISAEDTAEFIQRASAQKEDFYAVEGRLPSMTANEFFQFCAMGYAANDYYGLEQTPQEQYLIHSDGRDEGLCEIDPDSPEAYEQWRQDCSHFGGHPWEVCRGGNSTHIHLQPIHDEQGYFLALAGDAEGRTIETVKFYLALTRAGIPVYLDEAHALANRLAGTELIGIVPEGIIPRYCQSYFPNEHIINFMNLPYEDRESFLPFCHWYDEKEVFLLDN